MTILLPHDNASYLARYPISVPTYSTRRGAGSSTRPNSPFSVTDPTYRRSHRLFTPMKGDSCTAPTSPCQPTLRLVTPAPHESTTPSGVLASSDAMEELRVWSASRYRPL